MTTWGGRAVVEVRAMSYLTWHPTLAADVTDVLPYLAGIIASLVAGVAAVFTYRIQKANGEQVKAAARLSEEQDRGAQQIAGVKTSVESLEAALKRSDGENSRLRGDLLALRDEFAAHRSECNATVHRLVAQIVALGGQPDIGEGR